MGSLHGEAKQTRPRQEKAESPPFDSVEQRPFVSFLDVAPGVIDEVHVMDTRRAGRHARQAGQAAIDMLYDLGRRRAAILQHVLNKVNAPSRAVELVAEQDVGRACGCAKAAMDAGAQDLFRGVDAGVGQLGEGEIGLHRPY